MRSNFILLCAVFLLLCAGSATGQTQGLFGEYFGSVNMTGLRVTRTDPQVNFAWDTGSPHPSVGVDYFSVCWTGFVTPTQSGAHTIYVTADDGVRLWVDGVLLVNEWKNQAPTEYSATVTLAAGTAHPIRIDYYENAGGATMKLEWEGPGEARGAIPAARLTPGAGLGDRLLDWHRNPANGHFYKIIGPPMTWAAGKAQAAAMGGHLVTVDDAGENAWLLGMFRPVTDNAFIGANDIGAEGVWVWDGTGANFWNGAADGAAVAGFYANWNSGEPNNSGTEGEHVGVMNLASGVWNDLNVARERHCIVESPLGKVNFSGPEPPSATIVVGRRFQAKVTVRRPFGTVTYQWHKDGVEIPGATSATLTIPDVGYVHAGQYTCLIKDGDTAEAMSPAVRLGVVESLQVPAVSMSGLAALALVLAAAGALRRRR